jgi:alkanesulfonate monooxygenase SsuD/methylene tetrahydromethanopterin reductase-like flavin-dependent oxidoreductase (luciferase family)
LSPTFGISLPNRAVLFGVDTSELLDVTVRAEASGLLDSVWVGDNFFSQPRIESMVLLSAMAARTTRIRLGTLCLATFPMRHPLVFAVQWASLDLLSRGRTILGVCNGHSAREGAYFSRELDAMRVRSEDRASRLEEGIQVLRKAWSAGPVQHKGRFYEVEGVECWPKPVQPQVSILIAVSPIPTGKDDEAATEERMLRRVARLANGWQTGPRSPQGFRAQWARIHEYAAEYGRAHEITQSVIHFRVNINDDAEQARRDATAFTARYYADTLPPGVLEMSDRSLVCGPPQMIAERVMQFVEAGCTTPVFGFMAMDQRGQLERCLDSVLPLLRKTTSTAVAPQVGS